ncbi:MAG: site-specific integrase [Actinomycetota bacterium]|nr:site-specific integrase [Actinomycetota bacterium]
MSVFRRCTKCRPGKWPKGARRCPGCGSTSCSWEYVVELGRDVDGKRLRRWKAGFASEKDAKRAERELLEKVAADRVVDRSGQTVAAVLDRWLHAVRPRLATKTAHEWRRAFDRYVIPRVGHVEVQQLTSAHLSALYSDLLTSGGRDGGPLSATTVRAIHTRMRSALKDAVRWRLLDRNPAEDADPPAYRQTTQARRRAMRTWSEDELRRFLEATTGHRWHVLWEVAAATGLRRSELLGLRWRDLDGGLLAVRQTLVEKDDGWELVETTKSVGSSRTIPLDRRTVAVLRAHAKTQKEWQLRAGPAWEDGGLVFTDELGRPLSPPAVTQAFRRACEAAGVPRVRFHDVRHTHATLMLRAGVNPKVVSERLGHSSVAFTLDTYAHVIPGMGEEAVELFSTRVFGTAGTDDGRPTVGQNSPGDVSPLQGNPL